MLQDRTAADADSLSISEGGIMDVGATLAQIFAELGATGPMARTFLLRDRRFVGQRFRCGGFQAVLLAGVGEISFHDEGGTLVKTVRIEAQEEKAA